MTSHIRNRILPALLSCTLPLLAACSLLPARPQPTEPETGPLAGTSWTLLSLGPVDDPTLVVQGAAVTLDFGEVNQVAGTGGCNSFGGTVEVRGAEIAFSSVASTLMACLDEAVMDQEAQYFAALNAAETYVLSNGVLTIYYGEGEALVFSENLPEAPGSSG
jgi:putative lipoprotein